jgi:hypothetical protein
MIGAPMSLGFHTLKAGTRVASSAATFGCANPVLSLIEDVISLSLSLLAIFLPLAVPLAIALLVWLLWLIARRIRRGAATPTASAGSVP